MYKNRNMRGGHSTSHSAEFYGGDSGSYYTNPPVAGGSAYGQIRPVSFGTIVGGETGPNLAPYPNGSPIQTGGQGCEYRSNKNQSGGTSCDSHSPKQKNQFGGQGCPYKKSQTGGHCGCQIKPKRRPSARRRPSKRKQTGGNHCSGSHTKRRSRSRTGRGRGQSRRRTASRGRGKVRRGSQSKRHHTS